MLKKNHVTTNPGKLLIYGVWDVYVGYVGVYVCGCVWYVYGLMYFCV